MEDSLIYKRHSVRRYTDEAVTHAEIEELLRAAMQSPSAHDRRPWRFLVIENKEDREYIAESIETASFTKYAPVSVMFIADTHKTTNNVWLQDLAAATENFMLRATEMGLGTCWIGVAHMPDRVAKMRERFEIKEPYFPFSIVTVGHSARAYDFDDRFDHKRIDWGKFSG